MLLTQSKVNSPTKLAMNFADDSPKGQMSIARTHDGPTVCFSHYLPDNKFPTNKSKRTSVRHL